MAWNRSEWCRSKTGFCTTQSQNIQKKCKWEKSHRSSSMAKIKFLKILRTQFKETLIFRFWGNRSTTELIRLFIARFFHFWSTVPTKRGVFLSWIWMHTYSKTVANLGCVELFNSLNLQYFYKCQKKISPKKSKMYRIFLDINGPTSIFFQWFEKYFTILCLVSFFCITIPSSERTEMLEST